MRSERRPISRAIPQRRVRRLIAPKTCSRKFKRPRGSVVLSHYRDHRNESDAPAYFSTTTARSHNDGGCDAMICCSCAIERRIGCDSSKTISRRFDHGDSDMRFGKSGPRFRCTKSSAHGFDSLATDSRLSAPRLLMVAVDFGAKLFSPPLLDSGIARRRRTRFALSRCGRATERAVSRPASRLATTRRFLAVCATNSVSPGPTRAQTSEWRERGHLAIIANSRSGNEWNRRCRCTRREEC